MKKFALLLICLFLGQQIIACTCNLCNTSQNLCELLKTERLSSLIEAVLLETDGQSEKLQLVQNLYGTQMTDSIFYINLPNTCNTWVNGEVGDTVLLNFSNDLTGDPPLTTFETDTLSLFLCDYLALKRQGNQITGLINPHFSQMSFSDFTNYLQGAYHHLRLHKYK